jgi:hypothetical protein
MAQLPTSVVHCSQKKNRVRAPKTSARVNDRVRNTKATKAREDAIRENKTCIRAGTSQPAADATAIKTAARICDRHQQKEKAKVFFLF